MASAGGPLVFALRSLRFLSASQILFFFSFHLLIRAVKNTTGDFSPRIDNQSKLIITRVVYWRARRDVDRLVSKQKLRLDT